MQNIAKITRCGLAKHAATLSRERNMMRKLTLKKETLVELTTAELTGVVGAAASLKTDCGPTLSLTCGSEIDACITARGCTL